MEDVLQRRDAIDAEPAGHVRNLDATERVDDGGEKLDAEFPHERVVLEALVEVPTGDDHVVVLGFGQQDGDVLRVVLPVGVDLKHEIVVVTDGVLVARPDRATDARVEDVFDHRRAVLAGDVGGAVAGAVVDDDHLVDVLARALDDRADGVGLVVGGEDGDGSH